jgi:RimJ/RimL family protein N-acetyltransferase
VILQTRRLIIRKFQPSDLAGLIDMFTNPEVMSYIGPRRPMTDAEILNWLAEILHRQDSELTRYAVALKATDELIGVAGLRDEDGVKDFGYYFRRTYWGQGYARESCSAIIDYIENSLEIKDYQIFIADENINSIRMIKKLGMGAVKSITKSGEQGHLYQRNTN